MIPSSGSWPLCLALLLLPGAYTWPSFAFSSAALAASRAFLASSRRLPSLDAMRWHSSRNWGSKSWMLTSAAVSIAWARNSRSGSSSARTFVL